MNREERRRRERAYARDLHKHGTPPAQADQIAAAHRRALTGVSAAGAILGLTELPDGARTPTHERLIERLIGPVGPKGINVSEVRTCGHLSSPQPCTITAGQPRVAMCTRCQRTWFDTHGAEYARSRDCDCCGGEVPAGGALCEVSFVEAMFIVSANVCRTCARGLGLPEAAP